ncbi:DMT family transporter [Deinococcus seoulensis]|uniref:DMT family transporter n=1 Tax=Deinococcus seoulensis TaxID=1837379 RepID=UPI00166CD3D7|nr:multidrug efflux SMR transporter [Deinococcus seoulensis]
MSPLLLLGLAIVSEVVATSALRASEGFTRPWPSVLTVAGYGVAFWLMGQALRSLPIGYTYAVWSGVGTALVAVIGWVYFRDAFSWTALAGIALIVGGVALLNLGGGHGSH